MARNRRGTERGATLQGRRPTKAERREEARRRRAELQRRMERQRRNRRIGVIVVAAAALALGAFLVTRPSEERTEGPLPGLLAAAPPWDANTRDLSSRLSRLGLPAAGATVHVHAHLDVLVDGVPVPVPADIGVTPTVHSPLHTHAEDGVIHVESDTPRTFTLGEFFDVWGVRLSGTCLGASCEDGTRQLRVFVDGEEIQAGPRAVVLADLSQIVLAFGSEDQLPDPVPSEYDFSAVEG